MRTALVLTALTLLPLGTLGWADVLVLRDGTQRNGRFISGSGTGITFQDDNGGRRTYSLGDIQSVQFERQLSGRNGGLTSANTDNSGRSGSMDSRTIPTGADIIVRTNENIDSTSANEGRAYPAVVDRDVLDSSGSVLVPKGSEAELIVRDTSSGGTAGSSELVLDLQSLRVNGQRYLVSTADVTQSNREGLGKNRRTAEMVGGGAVLGTLLGAIAGGGKGAAIGAVAGGAAGAGVQVLTRGKEVKVPAETTLTFRLDKPVRLVSAQ
jgi:hypothetical protein